MTLSLYTPLDILHDLATRFKARRLDFGFTQEGLALRAGVSLGSLKRFERTGYIAFDSLLRLALVLECLEDFMQIAKARVPGDPGLTLDEILAKKKKPKRGRIK